MPTPTHTALDLADAARIGRAEARRWLSDSHDVDDVVQETLLRAWRNQDRRRSEDFRPWVRQIARREAWRHLERNRRYDLQATVDESLAPAGDVADGVPLRIDVGRAVAQLDSGDRALVIGRYGLDLTQEAIATALRMPEGTVKVRLHRVRKRLASVLAC
jgi:RNA polymerase sigma-70 factor, ECF subfamily